MARTFTVATTVPDPLLAQRLVEVLTGKGLDAFSRAGGAASSAAFAQAEPAFWDVLVPSEATQAAAACITEVLEALELDADQNAQAAEVEAMEPQPAGPTGVDR